MARPGSVIIKTSADAVRIQAVLAALKVTSAAAAGPLIRQAARAPDRMELNVLVKAERPKNRLAQRPSSLPDKKAQLQMTLPKIYAARVIFAENVIVSISPPVLRENAFRNGESWVIIPP